MTAPRQILEGTVYLVTRRVTQRQLWLKPSKLTRQIFGYCIAVAQQKSGLRIHAILVSGNHYHVVATDPFGRLPLFEYWLNKFAADCINASYGREGNLWDNRQPSYVELGDDNKVIDELAYTLANPAQDHLVEYSYEWPGLRTSVRELAGSETVYERPAVYFKDGGAMPKTATLRIDRPDAYAHLSDADYTALVQQAVKAKEAEARAKRNGRPVLGLARILTTDPASAPRTSEPRRQLNPRVACSDPARRVALLDRLKAFVGRHRAALKRFRSGARDVLWPPGTYQMRVVHNVAIDTG